MNGASWIGAGAPFHFSQYEMNSSRAPPCLRVLASTAAFLAPVTFSIGESLRTLKPQSRQVSTRLMMTAYNQAHPHVRTCNLVMPAG